MINIDRLITWLNQSNIQGANHALYQTIFYLIRAVKELQNESNASISGITDTVIDLENLNFLTHGDESANLPNSRQLMAGTGISFDDTVANQRTISSVAVADGVWTPMTDGDSIETDLIYADGECVMVFVPNP